MKPRLVKGLRRMLSRIVLSMREFCKDAIFLKFSSVLNTEAAS